MKSVKIIFLILLSAVGFSCSKSLVIENVNYAQHVESVVAPNQEGIVDDQRNNIRFSMLPLLEKEYGENSTDLPEFVRILRNSEGYYFITAEDFKYVYIFEPKRGELKLTKSILLAENGLEKPALNWRAPYIEVVSFNSDAPTYLDENGVIKK